MKKSGVIQGFWSVNPKPLDDDGENIKNTPNKGFIRIDSYSELESNLKLFAYSKEEFFSSMKTREELGTMIEIANREKELKKKAAKFLSLIRR